MIFKDTPLFWALLLGHLLGDFYLQSQKMAEGKRERRTVLLGHCAVYGGCVLAGGWALCGVPALRPAAAVSLAHAAIDGLKFHCRDQLRPCAPARIFLADQLLHLSAVAAAALWAPAPLLPYVPAVLAALECIYAPGTLLRLGCLILLLGKPFNALLKICNQKPADPRSGAGPSSDRDCRAGAVIGTLERLLTAALFLLGQYGAISVVFAAKTLTRYQKIVELPEFSEYYLIGTLGSLLLAILATVTLFPPG